MHTPATRINKQLNIFATQTRFNLKAIKAITAQIIKLSETATSEKLISSIDLTGRLYGKQI